MLEQDLSKRFTGKQCYELMSKIKKENDDEISMVPN